MIKATRNQLSNLNNQFQGDQKRVLTVCSAGMLRSPTAANTLHKQYGFNARACGSCKDFALIPISEVLIRWADEIVFTHRDNWDDLDEEEKALASQKVVTFLNIPDEHNWGEPELEAIILREYDVAWTMKDD